jgi:hypothetical protein
LPGRSGSRVIPADVHQPESATGSPSSGGHFVWAPPIPEIGRSVMRSEDLMSPDLLSEIVLLGLGELIFVTLLLLLMAALGRA